MKINLAKSAGFCFGVKRALRVADKASRSKKEVYMLGDIVHNEDVIRSIKKGGIKTIKSLGQGTGKTLLVRAHGASSRTLEKARTLGYKVIDATCPMVKEIHRIAKQSEKNGYQIIVIGDKKHDEVRGIVGQLKNKALVIDNIKNIPLARVKKIKRGAAVVQSTQNLDKVLEIVGLLKKYIDDLHFHNTICHPTRIKQQEIKIMPLQNDVMIIIGSRTSANTKRLYQISKSLNKHSFWIQSKKDINSDWFRGFKNVGIAAGASTPNSTTQNIINHLKKIT